MLQFIYDFITYPFGIYSSTVVNGIIGDKSSLYVTFGWNVVIKSVILDLRSASITHALTTVCSIYLVLLVAHSSSIIWVPRTPWYAFMYLQSVLLTCPTGAPRLQITGLLSQAVVGFIMSGAYKQLQKHIAAFAVVYGIFLSLGELGPGNNLGLLASKTGPTAIRGHFYGSAAAVGKVGAFVGTWAFPPMITAFSKHGADPSRGDTGPFWVGSGQYRRTQDKNDESELMKCLISWRGDR